MNRLEIRPQAEDEIRDAAAWYEQQLKGLGAAFVEDVAKALSAIIAHPLAFPPIDRGARHFVIRRFPYAIIYRQEAESIVVYSCFHNSRHPRRWRERL